ncbi:hypothetical protein Scep_018706 [Stephania cephalantha]|uniref:Uncharacterized protein n=1 Tax=Stephania cephalantha TaxID=152367 RepID=A0AAP0NKF9_9MAGN
MGLVQVIFHPNWSMFSAFGPGGSSLWACWCRITGLAHNNTPILQSNLVLKIMWRDSCRSGWIFYKVGSRRCRCVLTEANGRLTCKRNPRSLINVETIPFNESLKLCTLLGGNQASAKETFWRGLEAERIQIWGKQPAGNRKVTIVWAE